MTTYTQTPRVIISRNGAATIESYYVPALGARLCNAIPRAARRYDPHFRRWTIAPDWAAVGLAIFRALFPDGVIIVGYV